MPDQPAPAQNLPVSFPDVSDFPPMPAAAVPAPPQSVQTPTVPADLPDLPPMIPPAKKTFGSKKIIATILGILILVGGVGAGIFLVGQRQLFQQKAAETACKNRTKKECTETCFDGKKCKWGGKQKMCKKTNTDCNLDDDGRDPNDIDDWVSDLPCSAAEFTCSGCGGFCLNGAYPNGGCREAANALCGENIGASCNKDSPCPDKSETTCYYCPGNFTLAPCGGNTPLPPGVYYSGNCKIEGKWCGTVQCDGGPGICRSEINRDGCATNPPEGPTASCSNVKAYDIAWNLLSAAQLSALEANDRVNFCVSGIASSGAFTKARFTIQGVLRPETTAKRPGSNDFCDLYTIPAGSTTETFNVTAQIFHATLGWK